MSDNRLGSSRRPSTTRSGRPAPQYVTALSASDVANPLDEQDQLDQFHWNAPQKIKEVEKFAEERGFASIFDAFVTKCSFDPDTRISEDEIVTLLDLYSSNPKSSKIVRTSSPRFIERICSLAAKIFEDEVRELEATKSFRLGLREYTADTVLQFSFQKHAQFYEAKTPLLLRTLQTVFLSGGVKPHSAIPDYISCDSDDEVGYKYSGRNRELIISTAISSLLYARSYRNNRVQGQVGYWLVASKVPKTVIAVLNRLGISLPSNSIHDYIIDAIRKDCKKRLKDFCNESHACIPVFDNCDYYVRPRDQRLTNQPELAHRIVGFVGVNVVSLPQKIFLRSAIDRQAAMTVDVQVFTPGDENRM
jgi:hypothetical protein